MVRFENSRPNLKFVVSSDLSPELPSATVGMAPPAPSLTPRQRDCLLLVARGKSDDEIALILGISRDTAHKHVEAAKRRYSVTSRVRLVVDALFSNELSFAAIFATDAARQ